MIERHMPATFSPKCVVSGQLVFVGGITCPDESSSMKRQAEHVFAQLDTVLAAAGSERDKLLSVTIFITDMARRGELNEAWTAWFTDTQPTRAVVGVSELTSPSMLIELVAVAAR